MSYSGGNAAKPSGGEVEAFLKRFIELMDKEGLDLWPTRKNKKFEDDTGFSADDAELVIRSLQYKNYSDGPEPDDDPNRPPGEVWVFNSELLGVGIYLKLKMEGVSGTTTKAACLSFHEPARAMKTPLKVNGRGQPGSGRKLRRPVV